MGSAVERLLWACIILDSGVRSISLPEISDLKFIEECVKEHNLARSSVDPPAADMLYMTWDEALAITAKAWAKRCIFDHNIYLKNASRVHPTFPSVGENIWTAYPPSQFNTAKAIKSWVDEVKDYNYQENSCRFAKVCGHYTQVVWASTYKVGCAVQLCPDGIKHFINKKGVLFVCNYATAGNIIGRRPYASQGGACSRCSGTCENKLCRSPERDAQKSYNWSPDWDTSATSSSSSVSILITRPVALSFTFITAYVVHYFYPDVFCYE
ncbi:GLIPR1-like protein 1 isoform X1 [Pelmatolapia mariae]|uniref:GLIPR1-like protein 1 isoform X1 n=1 Tax=Pelmatolapia mariae TaxID=158779 RepID=UPI002FE6ABB5